MSYATEATSALAAIKAAGAALTFVRRGTTSVDPTTDAATQSADVLYTAYALVLKPLMRGTFSLAEHALMMQQGRRLLIAAKGLPVIPEPNDRTVFAGSTWVVTHCTPLDLDVGGYPIYYDVGVKR